jgi:hypothetical protein
MCSGDFLKNFVLRPGLSFQRVTAARRPEISNEKGPAVLQALNEAQEEFKSRYYF